MSRSRNQGIQPHRAVRGRQWRRRPLLVEHLEDRCLLSADAVLDWNAILLQANAHDHALAAPNQPGPVRTARAFAMVQAAIYDAVNAIDRSFTPYLVNVHASRGVSIHAAVAQAGHDMLVALYPQQRALFDAELVRSLEGIPLGQARQGMAVGRACAQHMMEARLNDGSVPDPPYTPINAPGFHRADPLHPNQGYYASAWGQVTPFTLTGGAQFRADARVGATPAERLAFLNGDEYRAAFAEVKALGAKHSIVRTAEQTEIGIFWAYDGTPGLGTPPRLYNQIARTIAVQQRNTEVENARLFALVNLAQADAGIASWETKYADNFWRPIVGIREAPAREGGDPTWEPLGAPCSNRCGAVTDFTPPFPSYTSGHATYGSSLFQMLRRYYGTDDLAFSFQSDEFNGRTTDATGQVRPPRTRSYRTLTEPEFENRDSRIYLGIHWRFDQTEGVLQGRRVADYVFDHYLLPRERGPGDAGSAPGFNMGLLLQGALNVTAAPTGHGSAVWALLVRLPADETVGGSVRAASRTVAVDDAWPERTQRQAAREGLDLLFGAPELLAAALDATM